MSSTINDQNYQTQRQMRMETEKETNQAINGQQQNVHGPGATRAVQGDGSDSFGGGVQGPGQNTPRLSHAAPLPQEPTRDAANDNGRGVGDAMHQLSGSGNMGGMTLQAQEMDVGYHKNERQTKQEDDNAESKNRKTQDQQAQAKAQKAQEAMRHLGEAAMIAACPLAGIIATAVIETKAAKKNDNNAKNGNGNGEGDTQSKHEQLKQNTQNAWASPVPGQNQGGQGQVQTATGPDGQPIVEKGGGQTSRSSSGPGVTQRPAPHSHQEQALFTHGAKALAQASDTLNATPQPRKAGQFG